MGDNTSIEWTRGDDGTPGATWNPTTGCDKVSPGCDHCYAMTLAPRLKAMGSAKYQRDGDPATSGPGFGITEHATALDQPLRWTRPRRIFVNSMSDLFHSGVSDEFIAQVFAVMALASRHTFQILTKRHARMRALLARPSFPELVTTWAWRIASGAAARMQQRVIAFPLPNVWLGVSVENQQWADIRIPALLETPAAVRFLSCEPLLGPVDIGRWLAEPLADWEADILGVPHGSLSQLGNLHWVIVGGESGHGARPMHPQWARQLRDQCVSAGVRFHFKQWGDWSPLAPLDAAGRYDFSKGHTLANDGTLYEPLALTYPDGPRYGEAVRAGHYRAYLTSMYRLGKKAAGRRLDGREWSEFPEVAHA